MKKVLFVLCSTALIAGAVSCKKENTTPVTPGENPGGDTPQPTYVEGVFNPGKHIASVTEEGEVQQWSWNNANPRQLTGIASYSPEKLDLNPSFNFTYNADGTMSRSSINLSGMTANINYNYNNGKLNDISVGTGMLTVLSGTVTYDANGKMQRMNVSGENLQTVSMILSTLVSGGSSNDLAFDSLHLSDTYSWNSNDVSSEKITGNVAAKVSYRTLDMLAHDQLVEVLSNYTSTLGINADSLLNEMVAALADSTLGVTMSPDITVNYTYDNNSNPFRGFWGKGLLLQPQALSANNVLTITTSGAIAVNISLKLPLQRPSGVTSVNVVTWGIIAALVNSQSPFSTEIPASELIEDESRTYQYSGEYPVSYTTGDKTVTYTYSD